MWFLHAWSEYTVHISLFVYRHETNGWGEQIIREYSIKINFRMVDLQNKIHVIFWHFCENVSLVKFPNKYPITNLVQSTNYVSTTPEEKSEHHHPLL